MKVCTRTSYSMPGDAVMVEAGENGEEQNTIKPPNIFDPSALLVYLEGKVRAVYCTCDRSEFTLQLLHFS